MTRTATVTGIVDAVGTSALTFAYAVTAEDGTVTTVEVPANAIALNDGTIRGASGLDADLSHEAVAHGQTPVANGDPTLSVADAHATEAACIPTCAWRWMSGCRCGT